MSGRQADIRNGYQFPVALRIKSRDEFQSVFAKGKVAADGTLVIHAIRKLDATDIETSTRIGLSISKRVGSAPVRNRWKRLIREAFRTQRRELPRGMLIVVRPKKGAEPNFENIKKSLPRLVRKLDRKV